MHERRPVGFVRDNLKTTFEDDYGREAFEGATRRQKDEMDSVNADLFEKAQQLGVEFQFTTAPGARYESGQSITLRLPKEQAWVVPTEDRIL